MEHIDVVFDNPDLDNFACSGVRGICIAGIEGIITIENIRAAFTRGSLSEKIKALEMHNGLTTDPRIERLQRARDLILKRLDALEARPVVVWQVPPMQSGPNTSGVQSYNPCQYCQTILDFNRQHPSGYMGDSPCSMCPSNPFRATCSGSGH